MHRRLSALSRIGPGVLSQGLNSLGNLVLVLAVARSSGASSFGAWSLIYTGYAAALVLSRTIASTPMLIAEQNDTAGRSADQRGSISFAMLIGVSLGLPVVGVGLLLGGPAGGSCVAFGIAMPVLLMQDALRYVFFQRKEESRAAAIDLVWFVLQLIGFAFLPEVRLDQQVALTGAWGLSALGSVIFGLLFWRNPIGLAQARSFIGRHRGASVRLFADAGLVAASGTALPFLLAWTAGLGAAGALRAGTTLMGGVAILVMAMTPIATVEAVAQTRSGRELRGLLRLWTLSIGIAAVGYGAVLLLLPDHIGHSLLGKSWTGAQSIMLPLLMQAVIRGPFTGIPIALRALRLLNVAVTLRMRTTVINTALPLLGGWLWGLQGAAWSIVVAAAVNNLQSVAAWRRATKRPISLTDLGSISLTGRSD